MAVRCLCSKTPWWDPGPDLGPAAQTPGLGLREHGGFCPLGLGTGTVQDTQSEPLLGPGVVGVYLSGYLIETTGSWTSLFHLVAAISNLGLCSFLVFGQAHRVDLSPAHEAL